MITPQQATLQFGFSPLSEVIHAAARVQSACGKEKQFVNLARMAKSDIVETRVYVALCDWLSAAQTNNEPISLQGVRRFCMEKLAVELSSRGLRESVVALTQKASRA